MSEIIAGNQLLGLHRQTGDGLTQLEDGTWEGQVIYICRWVNVVSLAPRRNVARHPDFPGLICNGCSVERLKPGVVAKLTAKYRGIAVPDPVVPPGTIPPIDSSTEEVITSTSDAPIETHPRFVSHIGGTAAAPLNSAKFDSDGVFKGFAAGSAFAGIESYVIPSTIYRRTNPSHIRPLSLGSVGTIVDPGIGGGSAGANWLYTSKTWRRDGGVYDVTEEYMLSGPGGWNTTIYNL